MNMELPVMQASAYASAAYTGIGTTLGGQEHQQLQQMVQQDRSHSPMMKTVAPSPKAHSMTRRIVQVFIADTNENVPLADSLLYRGEQIVTEDTDQELFHDIEIKSLLARHNELRIKVVNKAVKDRTEFLEPAKIRDLKMIVTTVAQF